MMTITVTSLYYLVLPCASEYAINRYKGTSEGEVISSLASRISAETGEGLVRRLKYSVLSCDVR